MSHHEAQASSSRPRSSSHSSTSSSISDSELLDTLDDASHRQDGFDYGEFRAKRLEEMKEAVERANASRDDRFGRVVDIRNERELILTSSKAKFCIIHFYKTDFQRCRIMDGHLQQLAPKHMHTLFLCTSVENAPFLVTRLDVKVLPCVICFVDGNAVDRIVGFEDLGNTDTFATSLLEFRLKKSGVLPPPDYQAKSETILAVRAARGADDEDERETDRDRAGREKVIGSIRQGGIGKDGRLGVGADDDDDDEYA